MSTRTTSINSSTWTEIADFIGVVVKYMTVSREEETDFEIAYDPNPTTAICKVTKSFIAFDTSTIPSGGKVYAKAITGSATIVVNWK